GAGSRAMVGTGPGGRTSALARCSIVAYDGAVLYDRYVRPPEPVVDYRTRWSGVRPRHLQGAVPFAAARRQILKILAGKVVVGHAISNDFKALRYFHPPALTRDTSRMPLLNRKGGFPENVAVSLKRLVKQLLNRDIQVGAGGPALSRPRRRAGRPRAASSSGAAGRAGRPVGPPGHRRCRRCGGHKDKGVGGSAGGSGCLWGGPAGASPCGARAPRRCRCHRPRRAQADVGVDPLQEIGSRDVGVG
uniref:Interferon stimulated exonuclease gene 20 like 2 n=1 Tax=Nothoprocta perdicaria TaxID=30464 RepID=A0A8C6YQ57_NOTPE